MAITRLELAASTLIDAAFDPAAWTAALQSLTVAINAKGILLLPIKGRVPGVPLSDDIGELVEHYFHDEWHLHDARDQGIPKLLRTGILVDQDFVTADSMKRMPFYQECLRPHDVQWFCGIAFKADDETWCAAIQRSPEQGPFTADEQQELLGIQENLSRAATLSRRFGLARIEGMSAVYDALDSAFLLVDRLGRLVSSNRHADRLVKGVLRIVRGELIAECFSHGPSIHDQIASALAAIETGDFRWLQPIIVLRRGQRPLMLRIIPIPKHTLDAFTPARAFLLVTDPEEAGATPMQLLQVYFSLSLGEASFAAAIAEGRSIEECAAEHRLTDGAARQVLKRIFAKTETHRQGELVALINRLLRLQARTAID